ncbi:MAG: glycosyltransferase [Planctomycetia bacterium]|nr:glycosyltransferase [Planctomycetia bacterium]
MSENLTVSVAVCTYHGEAFLRQQLESFSAQTHLPDEIIFGDDGSSDRTLEILYEWKSQVPFQVQVIRNPQNLGYAKNFENVLRHCTGDVIILSDQDDVWHFDRIARTVKFFQEKPSVGAVFCNANLINGEGESLDTDLITYTRPWFHFREAGWLFPEAKHEEIAIFGCAAAVKKEIVSQLFPMPDDWGHDVWIYGFTPYISEIDVLPECLFDYRLHGKNVSMKLETDAYRQWKNSYFRDAVYFYQLYEKKRNDIYRRLYSLPESSRKTRHVKFLMEQEKHLSRRKKFQDNLLLNFPWMIWEFLSGGYFRFPQPIKSILFDVKEGLSRYFHRKHPERNTS